MSHAFRLCPLASGSSGNAVYAECAEGAVLVDAGVSMRRIVEGLSRIGASIERVRAAVVTHDHVDHCRGAGVLARRHGIPLFMTRGTFERRAKDLHRTPPPTLFAGGDVLAVAGIRIETIPTPHDGVEPVAVILERHGARAGVLTDLGHPFDGLAALLADLDAVLLESNYAPESLRRGPYPPHLQARIRNAGGHLSNGEAAALVRDHAGERLGVLLLAHLSENNNTPECALATLRDIAGPRLAESGIRAFAARRHEPSEMIALAPRETGAAVR